MWEWLCHHPRPQELFPLRMSVQEPLQCPCICLCLWSHTPGPVAGWEHPWTALTCVWLQTFPSGTPGPIILLLAAPQVGYLTPVCSSPTWNPPGHLGCPCRRLSYWTCPQGVCGTWCHRARTLRWQKLVETALQARRFSKATFPNASFRVPKP